MTREQKQAIANAKARLEGRDPESPILGGLRTIADAALFGGGSEVSGGIHAAYGGARKFLAGDLDDIPETMSRMYKAGEENYRDRTEEFAAANPATSLGLNLVGALATGGPAAAAALPKAGATLASRMVPSTMVGLTEGATAGVLTAKPGERDMGALIGGSLGSGIGLSLPVIGRVLGQPARQVFEYIGKKFGYRSKEASDYLARAMNQAGITADHILSEMKRIGPGAAPVDTAHSLADLGEAAVQTVGRAREVGKDFVDERAGGQMDRITDLFESAVGPTGKQVMLREEDNPVFKEILTRSVPVSKKLVEFLRVGDIQKAYNKAKTNAIRKGGNPDDFENISNIINKIESGDYKEVTMDLLHKIKIGLDGVIEPMKKAYKTGSTSSISKDDLLSMNDLRGRFRDLATSLDTDYGASLRRMNKEFAVDDAYELGQGAFKPSVSVPALVKSVKNDERTHRAFRRGVADKALSLVEGAGELGNDVSTPLIRRARVLRESFGDAGDPLVRALKDQRAMKQVANKIDAGSQTALRLSNKEALKRGVSKSELLADAVGVLGTGGSIPPISSLRAAANVVRKYRAGDESNRILDELGETVLFNQNPDAVSKVLAGVAAKQRGQSTRQTMRNILAGPVSQLGSLGDRDEVDWSNVPRIKIGQALRGAQ